MSDSSSDMKLKLVVDQKSGKVIYAEASKDFVDFLFSLMSLPLGQIMNLLTNTQMVGSIANLYGSIGSLDETYAQSLENIESVLYPKSPVASFQKPLLLSSIESLSLTHVQSSKNTEYVSNLKLAPMVSLQNPLLLRNVEIVWKKVVKGKKGNKPTRKYIESSVTSYRHAGDDLNITACPSTASLKQVDSGSNTSMGYKLKSVDSGSGSDSGGLKQVASESSGGFVKGVVTYKVMDNLEVKPMSDYFKYCFDQFLQN